MPEIIVTLYSNTVLEPAARITSGPMKVHMKYAVEERDDGSAFLTYSTVVLPSELEDMARFEPEISGHKLGGFTQAASEYFKRTSHLKNCD